MAVHTSRLMLCFVLAASGLLANCTASTPDDNGESQAESAGDGPRVGVPGRFFRKFVKAMGGQFTSDTTGTLPYSKDLFQNATHSDKEGHGRAQDQFLHFSVAHGRSLERHVTDEGQPRHVVAFRWLDGDPTDDEPSIGPRNDMFIAYTAKNRQLQIIAPSDGFGNGGANDFILVDDFGPGGHPQFSYAPPGLCTACHQGGAPLAVFDPASEFREESSVNPTRENLLNLFEERAKSATTSAEFTTGLRVCGTSVACRWELVKLAAQPSASAVPDIVKSAYRALPPTEQDAIRGAYRNFELYDRDPASGLKFPFAENVDPLVERPEGWVEHNDANIVRTELPGPKDLDPENLSDEGNLAIIEGGRSCAPIDVDKTPGPELRKAIPTLTSQRYIPKATAELLQKKWPLSAADTRAIAGQLGDSAYLSEDEATKLQGSLAAPLAPRATQPLPQSTNAETIFLTRCATCHGGQPLFAPPFTFEQARTYKGDANDDRNPYNLVKNGMMPPFGADALTDAERETLLKAFDPNGQ